jgi:hypothetical protein
MFIQPLTRLFSGSLGSRRTGVRGGLPRVLGPEDLVLSEVRGLEGCRRRWRRRCRGTARLPFQRGGEQRRRVDDRSAFRYRSLMGPGVPRPGTTALQLGHLGVRAQDPHLRRAEIDERRDPVLDADHPAEAVHVVGHLVAHREVLGSRRDPGLEGAGGQMALQCSRLCHCPQYAPAGISCAAPVHVGFDTYPGGNVHSRRGAGSSHR